jgi:hypothetical protein
MMMEMNGQMVKYYMDVKENDPTNHKIHSYVNEQYFYKGLERAKVEKLFTDENGRVDLFGLVQFFWGAFADGRIVALPNHECRKAVTEYITKITSCDDEQIEGLAEKIIEAKPKVSRKSRVKPKVNEAGMGMVNASTSEPQIVENGEMTIGDLEDSVGN